MPIAAIDGVSTTTSSSFNKYLSDHCDTCQDSNGTFFSSSYKASCCSEYSGIVSASHTPLSNKAFRISLKVALLTLIPNFRSMFFRSVAISNREATRL